MRAKYASVYIFTDGRTVFDKDVLSLKPKSFIINSSPTRDATFLKRTALLTRSRLMDFASILPENLEGIKKNVPLPQMVSGTVYIDNTPAANVKVAVKGVSEAVRTDANGNFKIPASKGDSLLVTSRSKNTLKTIAVRGDYALKVFMDANIYKLDEVVLVEELQQKEQLTATAYGFQNKEKLGYATQSIGDEDISPIQTNVSQSIKNRFSNVNIGNSDGTGGIEDISKTTMRSNTSLLYNNYSLVVIDGIPQRQGDSSRDAINAETSFAFLDPDNIADITVLKGYAATNKYGTLGANGVILITTKTALAGGKKGEKQDLARLKNNVYEEADFSNETKSAFLRALEGASSSEEAYNSYLGTISRRYKQTKSYCNDAFCHQEV